MLRYKNFSIFENFTVLAFPFKRNIGSNFLSIQLKMNRSGKSVGKTVCFILILNWAWNLERANWPYQLFEQSSFFPSKNSPRATHSGWLSEMGACVWRLQNVTKVPWTFVTFICWLRGEKTGPPPLVLSQMLLFPSVVSHKSKIEQ